MYVVEALQMERPHKQESETLMPDLFRRARRMPLLSSAAAAAAAAAAATRSALAYHMRLHLPICSCWSLHILSPPLAAGWLPV